MSVIDSLLKRGTGTRSRTGVLDQSIRTGLLLAGGVMLLFGVFAQLVNPFWLNLLTHMLIFGLLALSLDFVFGYTGLLSFGHAAMFGAGGYAAALLLTEVTQSALVVLPITFLSGVFIAALIGWLSVRATGIYFAMLTLAFAQMFYTIAFNDIPAILLGVEQVTGGDNGLVGIPQFTILGIDTTSMFVYYYLTLILVAISLVVIIRVANSPFGRVLQGIQENEERLPFIGYPLDRYKIIAFSISGGFAGLAGGLYVPFKMTAHPNLLHWTVSGELIVMILLGGMGTLWGPMIGASLVVFLEDTLSGIQTWEIILGSIYVTIVLFAPNGIVGLVTKVNKEPRAVIRSTKKVVGTYLEKIR